MIKKLVIFICSILTVSAYAQVNIKGSQIDIGGVPQAGVTEVIPGTNINCTPLVSGSCTGNVTVSSTGGSNGVQYNPSNTSYIYVGSSVNADDHHVLGQTIPVSSGSCTTSTCTMTNTGTNGLSVGDWVYVSALTGWPTIPSPYGSYSTGYGSFQVTAATSTSFSFNSTLGAATITGGNAYGANSWVAYAASRLPFLNGHGNPLIVMGTSSYCSDLDANYTTMLHPLSPAVTGHPAYLIVLDCHNDYNPSTATIASIETTYTDLATKWHTDGGQIVVSDMSGQVFNGLMTNPNAALFSVRSWMWSTLASKNFSTTNNAYADIMVDALGTLPDATSVLFNSDMGQLAPGGANLYASLINNTFATQGTATVQHTPWVGWGSMDGGNGAGYYFSPGTDSYSAFQIFNAALTSKDFNVDTIQGVVSTATLNVNSKNPNTITAVSNGVPGVSTVVLNQIASNFGGSFTNISNFGAALSSNDSISHQFFDSALGSTSNYYAIRFYGNSVNFFKAIATGEIDFPTVAPASGGPDCLQISTTGSITNTGAPCQVGGTLPIANGGTGATTASAALANLGALPLSGGTMTGTLILNADPTVPLGAVTKQYIDTIPLSATFSSPLSPSSTNFYGIAFLMTARNIVVTRMFASLTGTALAGCTVQPTVFIQNGGTYLSTMPFTNDTFNFDSGPLSIPVAAGSTLTLGNTSGTGCTGGSPWIIFVQYQTT